MFLPPGSHDERVVDRDAGHFLDTLTTQLRSLLHEPWEMSLNTGRRTEGYHGSTVGCVLGIFIVNVSEGRDNTRQCTSRLDEVSPWSILG